MPRVRSRHSSIAVAAICDPGRHRRRRRFVTAIKDQVRELSPHANDPPRNKLPADAQRMRIWSYAPTVAPDQRGSCLAEGATSIFNSQFRNAQGEKTERSFLFGSWGLGIGSPAGPLSPANQ